MKRVLLVSVIICCITVSAMAGAQGESSFGPAAEYGFSRNGYPVVEEPVTLTAFAHLNPALIDSHPNESGLLKHIEELTNVSIDIVAYGVGSDYHEKKALLYTTGEYPDIWLGARLSAGEEVQWALEEVLVPLNDLIEEFMPNFYGHMTDIADLKPAITTPDGNIYALPNLDSRRVFPLWIRENWLDVLGLEMPQTTDEFYEVLKAFKNQDPNQNGRADEIPFTGYSKNLEGNDMKQILSAFGLLSSQIQVMDGKVIYGRMEPEYRAYLTYVNRLMSEDLLERELLTQGRNDWMAKLDVTGIGFGPTPPWSDKFESIEVAHSYGALPALTSPVNGDKLIRMNPPYWKGNFAISTTCEYPEIAARWADYMYSFEGMSKVAQEGYAWEWADEDQLVRRLYDPAPDRWDWDLPSLFWPSYNLRFFDANADKITIEEPTERSLMTGYWNDGRLREWMPHVQVPFPPVYLSAEDQALASEISGELQGYARPMEAAFVTGEESLDLYDEFVSQMVKLRVNDLIAIYQKAYDRYQAVK